jgi:hypothetical protein
VVKVILLDSGLLGLLAKPNQTRQAVACRQWAADLKAAGHRLIVPEIIDYELRRELFRIRATVSLALLDALPRQFEYAALDTSTMHRAAELWAQARQGGQPTASNKYIDADMILIALGERLSAPNTVIATTNLRHFRHFFPADLWTNISP